MAANPVCMPSRASLLTGLYPPAHNVWCNGVALPRRGVDLPENAPAREEPATLADVCAAAGFDTAALGKLHLTPGVAPYARGTESGAFLASPEGAAWRGPYYGFRHWEWTHGHGPAVGRHGPYADWLRERDPAAARRLLDPPGAPPVPGLDDLYALDLPFDLHVSAWLAERAAAYLERERPRGRPFLLFVGFPDPHHPFTPCRELLETFAGAPVPEPLDAAGEGMRAPCVDAACQVEAGRHPPAALREARRYTAALVAGIDRAVGRILDALDRAGLREDTVVAFTSDHGDFLGDHGRLRKGTAACDALLRVPLLLRAPGSRLPARIDAPVSNVDVMPTLLAAAGAPVPAGLDGLDLATAPRDRCAFAFAASGRAGTRNLTAFDERRRYTWYPGADYEELFDHEADPAEVRNLAGEPAHRAVAAHLRAALGAALARTHNPLLARIGPY